MEVRSSQPGSPFKGPVHTRSRSAGVILKSIVSPGKKDAALPNRRSREERKEPSDARLKTSLELYNRRKQSREQNRNSQDVLTENKSPLRKESSPAKPSRADQSRDQSPRKPRPLSGFNAVFSKQKPMNISPPKNDAPKEKENLTPPQSACIETRTPIWAEFTSQQWKDNSKPTHQAMNAQRNVQDELIKYAPQRNSPSKTSQLVNAPSPSRKTPFESRRNEDQSTRTASRPATDIASSSDSPLKRKPVMRVTPKDLTTTLPPQSTGQSVVASAQSQGEGSYSSKTNSTLLLQGKELEVAFEAMLVTRNIPEPTRVAMRSLDIKVKYELIRQDAKPLSSNLTQTNEHSESNVSETTTSPKKTSSWSISPTKSSRRKRDDSRVDEGTTDDESCPSPSKRSRSRTRTWTLSKRDRSTSASPTKRSRSGSRTRGLMSLKNFSSSSVNSVGLDGSKESREPPSTSQLQTPAQISTSGVLPKEYVDYLSCYTSIETLEVGRLQRLRRLLRNETVAWVTTFISLDGMNFLVSLLQAIMALEWREEHEDLLLHETLNCLKSLCTTELALIKLNETQPILFPQLLNMLFDDERKGPSEFTTRGIIVELLFTHIASAPLELRETRAKELLTYLADPQKKDEERPIGFVEAMSRPRPYRRWCREISNTTKEVFWIFIHHSNIIDLPPPNTSNPTSTTSPDASQHAYLLTHFPPPRPPIPSAPHVGGPEFEATNYLATHLELLNAILASLSTTQSRNQLRRELRDSGFEKVMGGSLRTCKERFYGVVHRGLEVWVSAAREDAWDTEVVVRGLQKPFVVGSAGASPVKGPPAPRIELPALGEDKNAGKEGDGWLGV